MAFRFAYGQPPAVGDMTRRTLITEGDPTDGLKGWPSYGPPPISRRYATTLDDRELVPLPDPGLDVDDVY
jgi:hypothetical protein